MEAKKRNIHLDTLGGIFVLYMIFGHCCQFAQISNMDFYNILSIIFNCYMPWFFFKSGMFFSKSTTAKEIFRKSINKFFRPYCVFMLIGYIGYCSTLFLKNDTNWVHYILSPVKQCLLYNGVHSWALPLWFLVTLCIVKYIAGILLRRNLIIIGPICIIGGYIAAHINECFLEPSTWFNIFPAIFFYWLGFLFKKVQYHIVVFVLSVVLYIISFIFPSIVSFRVNQLILGSYFLWVLYASAGIVFFNNIFKKFQLNIFPFTIIGKNSLYWFLSHWFILEIISLIYNSFSFSIDRVTLSLIYFSSVIIILALLYPFIYGSKMKSWIGLE